MKNLDRIVVAYGRFNPPTVGHAILTEKVLHLAADYNCDHEIIVSHVQDIIRNPLDINRKLYYLKLMNSKAKFFPSSKSLPSLMEFLRLYSNKNYKKLTYVCGFDRMKEFNNLINKYNGIDYNFNEIEIVESGNLELREQYSATDLRNYIRDGNFIEELFPYSDTTTSYKLFKEVQDVLNKREKVI